VTVNHNLGKRPAVTIIDSAGDEVFGDVNHISAPLHGQNSLIQNCHFKNVFVPTFNLGSFSYGIGANNYDSQSAKFVNCLFETNACSA
jgi:hypothetical protein